MNAEKARARRSLFALAAVVIVFFVFGITHLGGLRWDYDEGVQAMEARLVLDGYSLYREVFSSDMPLFVGSLVCAFKLFGSSIEAARLVTLVYAIAGLLAVGLLARFLGDAWAGVAAALVLIISPPYFLGSRVCLEDIPSIGLAMAGLFLLCFYDRFKHFGWLALAGVVYGLALSLKLLPVVLLPLFILFAVRRNLRLKPAWLQLLGQVATFLGAVGLPLLLSFALFDFNEAMFDQLVRFPAQATTFYSWSRSRNWVYILYFFVKSHPGATALAVFGVWAGATSRRITIWPMVSWLLLMGSVLLFYVPLWSHLLVSLLFPLTVLSGIGFVEAVRSLRRRDRRPLERWASLLTLAVFLVSLPWTLVADVKALWAPSPASAVHAIEWIAESTPSDAFILTDEPLIPFVAGRRVPPGR